MQQQRTMPHSIETEQSILGAIFVDPKVVTNVVDLINGDDFYAREHRIIYDCLVELHNEKSAIDLRTINARLVQKGLLSEAGGLEYIIGLSQSIPSSANVNSYVELVKDYALRRKMIEVGTTISTVGLTSELKTTDFIDEATRMLSEVSRKRKTSDFRDLSEVVDTVLQKIEDNITSGKDVVGFHTGFSNMDKMTYGLQREDLMILAARPSVGKTAFALNLAVNVAKLNNTGVAVFSMEMSAEQLVNRLISREAGISADKLKKGPLSVTDWAKLAAAGNILKKQKFYFDDGSGTNVNELRAKCRKLYESGNLGFIVIDYLQLMSGGDHFGGNRQQEVSYISRTLKEIAREFKVPVLALSQLSRDVEKREDKRPKMADLRESGSIEQDADIIMFLYREDYQNHEAERPNIVECDFAKNRHGQTGKIEFKFNKDCSQFNAIAYQKDDKPQGE